MPLVGFIGACLLVEWLRVARKAQDQDLESSSLAARNTCNTVPTSASSRFTSGKGICDIVILPDAHPGATSLLRRSPWREVRPSSSAKVTLWGVHPCERTRAASCTRTTANDSHHRNTAEQTHPPCRLAQGRLGRLNPPEATDPRLLRCALPSPAAGSLRSNHLTTTCEPESIPTASLDWLSTWGLHSSEYH